MPKEKDSSKPKRGMSAFFFFAGEKRAGIAKSHPEWKVTDVAKELGVQWKKVSAGDKKKYEEMAAKDKARYEKEKAAASKKH